MNASVRRIRQLALQSLEGAAQTCAPVEPELIAKSLGVSVLLETFEGDVSGILVRQPKRVVIAVNKAEAPVRRRFTIAHELGHFVLQHQGELFIDHSAINRRDGRSSAAIDPQEIEANAFAAELLMPEAWISESVEQHLSDGHEGVDLVGRLARQFGVSTQAMNFRLINLGLIQPGDV